MFYKGNRINSHSVLFTDGIRNCKESIFSVLNSKTCFDCINLFVMGDKLGKLAFVQKRKKNMFNRKALVMDKFKNYGQEKEIRRKQLTAAGGGKKGRKDDPLKEDKVFLKKLAKEFISRPTRYLRLIMYFMSLKYCPGLMYQKTPCLMMRMKSYGSTKKSKITLMKCLISSKVGTYFGNRSINPRPSF